jgi:hypothetical protein
MSANPVPFPRELPPTYEATREEPAFDPKRHLALEPPQQAWRLADLGYTSAQIRKCASAVAVAGPFRLLSQEGVAAARSVALALRDRRLAGDRTASYLTGGVYRSKFLRELCACPQIVDFVSAVAGCELLPHSMPSQQVYINYAPDDVTKAVDTWHVDSIGFDYVLLLNDPASFSGGRFEFFRGTKDEAARLLDTDTGSLTGATSKDLPPDRVVSPQFPAAGYALFQQGNLVVHRATRLAQRAERITFVPGFVACDTRFPDPTSDEVADWGEPGIVAEFARHKAWLARAKLDELIEHVRLGAAPAELRADLKSSVADVLGAIAVMERLPDRPGTDASQEQNP